MTIMAYTTETAQSAPAVGNHVPHTPDPREKSVGARRWTHDNPHPYYRLDPVAYRPDGTRAPAVPGDRDPGYGVPTTDTDIFAQIDGQPIGVDGTRGYTIGQAGGFTRKRRLSGAPKMTATAVLDLAPHRVARALTDILGDWSQVTTAPYTQLMDLCLTAKDRTTAAAEQAAAADRQVDRTQLDPGYRSKAEEILASLDPAPVDDRDTYGDDGDLLYTDEHGTTVTVADYTAYGLFPSDGTAVDDPSDFDVDTGSDGGFGGDDPAFVDTAADGDDHGDADFWSIVGPEGGFEDGFARLREVASEDGFARLRPVGDREV